MQLKVTFKEVLFITKLSVLPIWCWPLPINATKLQTFCMKLFQFGCIILAMCLELPLIYGLINHIDDAGFVLLQIVISNSTIHITANFISYQLKYKKIQNVTHKMEKFCDLMKPREKDVIQRYINKCVVFYGVSLFTFYFVAFYSFALIPVLQHQPFPSNAEYPFDVLYQPLRTIIYLNQSIVSITAAAHLCLNVYMALLLWYTTAKFEILIEEIRETTNIYQLFKCITVHQELIEYADEVTSVIRPFAFIAIVCATLSSIITFLVFVTSSTNVAQAAFDIFRSEGQSIKMQRCLQIIIMRSTKPIVVSVPCFLPALSHKYFATFCSTIMSYFTTLRVVLLDE